MNQFEGFKYVSGSVKPYQTGADTETASIVCDDFKPIFSTILAPLNFMQSLCMIQQRDIRLQDITRL